VLRGRFNPQVQSNNPAAQLEWCDRRLLARIHRLTLDGLRRQIEPVSIEQYACFLAHYQHLQPSAKLHGQSGLLGLIGQLEGFHAPAGHWEKFLLPSRLDAYEPGWLDALTFHGQVTWGRLRPNTPQAETSERGRPLRSLTRATPITLMLREHVPWLLPNLDENSVDPTVSLSSNARAAYESFTQYGALYAEQLARLLTLLPDQVEDVLGELAAAGLVTSDGYPALRTLLASRRKRRRSGHRGPRTGDGRTILSPPGRWTLLRSPLVGMADADQRLEGWCQLLIRRYGVVFRDLLVNESVAPPWHQLVRMYRRLEARGELRGGRFVAGVGGEQYAAAEVIPMLRSAGNASAEEPVTVSATDPVNLTGAILGNSRIPALPGNSLTLPASCTRSPVAAPIASV
jgi:ATP-dependent Lhr-like helicase